MMNDKKFVPIWEKYTLTISEASEYFNLGEKKLSFQRIVIMIMDMYCKMETKH